MAPVRGKRGRGRGGARGDAAAPSRDEQPTAGTSELNSTPPNETGNIASLSQQTPTSQISPNSSPVSAPTETPAPTPARAPVQRLESLMSGPSARGSTGTRGKFKPRAVRRDKDERDRAAKEEQARINAREHELKKLGGGANRGGGPGGRGRGMGSRGRGRGSAMGSGRLMASGLFGVAPAPGEKRPGTVFPSISGGGGGSGGTNTRTSTATANPDTKVKQESNTLSSFGSSRVHTGRSDRDTDVKPEIPEPVYPEEQEEGGGPAPRVDIEGFINLVSDDDDDVEDSSKLKSRGKVSVNKGGLRPVRLQRVEHQDRVTMINTEPAAASLLDGADDSDDDDIKQISQGDYGEAVSGHESKDNARHTGGGFPDEDEVQVKPDPDSVPDDMDVDSEPKTPTIPVDSAISTLSVPKAKAKAAKKTKDKSKKVQQTEEEKDEERRTAEDIRILAEELCGLHTQPTKDDGDDLDNDESKGRLYLFQFPGRLPPLINTANVKEADVVMVEAQPAEVGASRSKTAKVDPEEEVVIKVDPDAPTASTESVSEAGHVGKLIIRKSGKVELDWGGTGLLVSRGVPSDYLKTTLLIDGESGQNKAYAMGQVMGKMIVTPDLSEL